MTTDERIDRLTQIVDALAATVVAHDNQIEALAGAMAARDRQMDAVTRHLNTLAQIVEKHDTQIKEALRQFEAYLRRLPPQ